MTAIGGPVKTRRAAATISALSATGTAALVLGAWCGSAFASADVQAPRDDEIASAAIRTIDAPAKQKDKGEKEDVTISKSETPDITTRLPGVSVSDSPRFRRQMYRTDI